MVKISPCDTCILLQGLSIRREKGISLPFHADKPLNQLYVKVLPKVFSSGNGAITGMTFKEYDKH